MKLIKIATILVPIVVTATLGYVYIKKTKESHKQYYIYKG